MSLRGVRVLLVEDESDARQLVSHVLEQRDAEVHAVASAAEALDGLEAFHPDVLVSDIGLPEVDGYQLIEQLRQKPAGEGGTVPALALTAFARTEDRTRALLAGYDMHLSKPVEPAELLATVSTLARLARRQRGGSPEVGRD